MEVRGKRRGRLAVFLCFAAGIEAEVEVEIVGKLSAATPSSSPLPPARRGGLPRLLLALELGQHAIDVPGRLLRREWSGFRDDRRIRSGKGLSSLFFLLLRFLFFLLVAFVVVVSGRGEDPRRDVGFLFLL